VVTSNSDFLLGNEAAALGAIDAGISAAYAYPGTPSTEVVEYVHEYARTHGGRPHCSWGANEKTAYEEALGVTLVGKRALVAMKHVGLNVAADPFMNSALLAIHAGLVVLVADDPSMHSSQNEQDSRYYADFARIPCFEPATHQEAYDMTREAFDVSERFEVPVMVRLVTRLAHTRDRVATRAPIPERAFANQRSAASACRRTLRGGRPSAFAVRARDAPPRSFTFSALARATDD
jgi:indolepyruvate ferredoxin oxidoreductase alpha subunit